ncbi:hypothetical protein QTO34_019905, partial [Cnephaeus nilssonii]
MTSANKPSLDRTPRHCPHLSPKNMGGASTSCPLLKHGAGLEESPLSKAQLAAGSSGRAAKPRVPGGALETLGSASCVWARAPSAQVVPRREAGRAAQPPSCRRGCPAPTPGVRTHPSPHTQEERGSKTRDPRPGGAHRSARGSPAVPACSPPPRPGKPSPALGTPPPPSPAKGLTHRAVPGALAPARTEPQQVGSPSRVLGARATHLAPRHSLACSGCGSWGGRAVLDGAAAPRLKYARPGPPLSGRGRHPCPPGLSLRNRLGEPQAPPGAKDTLRTRERAGGTLKGGPLPSPPGLRPKKCTVTCVGGGALSSFLRLQSGAPCPPPAVCCPKGTTAGLSRLWWGCQNCLRWDSHRFQQPQHKTERPRNPHYAWRGSTQPLSTLGEALLSAVLSRSGLLLRSPNSWLCPGAVLPELGGTSTFLALCS